MTATTTPAPTPATATPAGPGGIRYAVVIADRRLLLDQEGLIPWARGVAAANGQPELLDFMDPSVPEDTNRVQALQVLEYAGMLSYLAMLRPDAPADPEATPGQG